MPRTVAAYLLLIACCLLVGCPEPTAKKESDSPQPSEPTEKKYSDVLPFPADLVDADVPPKLAPLDDLPEVTAAEGDWPWWRGPTRNNVAAADQDPPIKWSETENVVWKTPVAGKAWSSPVIWGDHVWMSNATEDGTQLSVLCIDKNSGKVMTGFAVDVSHAHINYLAGILHE